MVEIVGTFADKIVRRKFNCVLDAMDFRDHLDAHYVLKIEWVYW